MPFTSLTDIKKDSEYKKILKEEMKKVRGQPVKFQYFEGFKFETAGKKPLLLVGPLSNEVVDAVKNTGATFKAKGRCARRRGGKAGDVDFVCDTGTMVVKPIKETLVWASAISAADDPQVVKELGPPDDSDVEAAPDAPKPGHAKDMQAFTQEAKKLTERLEAVKSADPAAHGKLAKALLGAAGSLQSGDAVTANKVLGEVAEALGKLEAAIKLQQQAREQAKKERDEENEAVRKSVAEANPDQEINQAKLKLQALVARSKIAFKALANPELEGQFGEKSKAIVMALAGKKLEGLAEALEQLEKLLASHEKTALPAAREKVSEAVKAQPEAQKKTDEAMEQLGKDPAYLQARTRLDEIAKKLPAMQEKLKTLRADGQQLSTERSKEKKNKKKFDQPIKDNKEAATKASDEIKQLSAEAQKLGETVGALEKPALELVAQLEKLQSQWDALVESSSVHNPPSDEELEGYKKKPDPSKDAISKNESLKAAREALKAKVGEMADASKWQGEEIEKASDPNSAKHGTGRHGAQTGIEGQGRRLATEEAPDQRGNKSGVTRATTETTRWRELDIQWETLKDGKRKIVNEVAVKNYVADWSNKPFVGDTASLFLNPVLEKYAVDTAKKAVKARCPWTWKQDGGWQRLKKVAVIVPPKPGTAGYGFAVNRKHARDPVKVQANAARHIESFVNGLITIDKLMDKLDVELMTDATGTGAKILPHAKVVLVRDQIESTDWDNETQFPVGDPAGWPELQGKTVARGTAPPTGATPTEVVGALVF